MGLIANMKTVLATGPTAATQADANNPNGPIMDYVGNTNGVLTMLEEAKVLIGRLISVTDAGDPSLSTLNSVNSAL